MSQYRLADQREIEKTASYFDDPAFLGKLLSHTDAQVGISFSTQIPNGFFSTA